MVTRRSLLAVLCGAALCAPGALAQDLPALEKGGRLRVLAVPVNEGPQFIAGGFTDTPARRAQIAFSRSSWPRSTSTWPTRAAPARGTGWP